MKKLKKLLKDMDIKIIEDCSQAHGAKFKGKMLEILEILEHLAFTLQKILGAFGDAGAIVTNKKSLFEKAQKIANHGRVDTYDHFCRKKFKIGFIPSFSVKS